MIHERKGELSVPASERAERAAHPRGAVAAAAAALVGVFVLAGCSDGGMTDGDERPAALVRLSAEVDTTLVGAPLDPPLTVRVNDASGGALAGVEVQFAILAGTGTLEPTTATTGGQGEATAGYTGGSSAGTTTIEARVPGTTVAPVRFEIAVRPPDEVRLSAVGGDGQTAEPGSQLPAPFVVRAVTPTGAPAGGVRIVWTVEEEPAPDDAAARLSPDTAFTGEEGEASTLLTLADAEGDHVVRAVAPDAPAAGGADTIRFAASGDPAAVGGVVLDSVRPLPLTAGGEATLFGSGFAASAGDNTVTVEGAEATVREASETRLAIDVPAFEDRCLPARSVGVRVKAPGGTSGGPFVPLLPTEAPLDLAVGETRSLTEPGAVDCLQLAASDGDREFRFQVQSASQSSGANTPMRLIVRSGEDPGASPSVRRLAPSESEPFAAVRGGEHWASAWHLRFRENAVREAVRRGARPARPEAPAREGLRLSHTAAPPVEGDTLDVVYAVDGTSVSCTDTTRLIRAVVKEVGERVALLEDTLARQARGAFDDEQYEELRAVFDDAIFATDSAYFGGPTDIDHNERVLVLITPEVNKLTPENSNSLITGFFIPTDLADAGDPEGGGTGVEGTCPTSNEGEILYLLAPDRDGLFGGSSTGPAVSNERAFRSALGTSSHEHQHLLNTAIRLIEDGGSFTASLLDTWLDEGMSHVAEEVVGYEVTGHAPRQNLRWDDVSGDETAFGAFFFPNFGRLQAYWANPSNTRAVAVSDPGGTSSLRLRGFGWIFLRWLADQEVPAGGGGFLGGPAEEAFFRELARGGPSQLTGTDNVLRALEAVAGTSASWGELIADFSPAAHVDDDVAGVEARHTLPSWDVRDVFRRLNEESDEVSLDFPLDVVELDYGAAALEFSIRGSAQSYVRLTGSGPLPALSLELASTAGGPVPSSAVPQVTVVRVR